MIATKSMPARFPLRLAEEPELNPCEAAVSELKKFLEMKEGSSLRAWLKHFDVNNDQKISFHEFQRGMRKLEYNGDIHKMFKNLDIDGSGELSLDEVDPDQAGLWLHFRRWCVETFDGIQDMVRRILLNDMEQMKSLRGRPMQKKDSTAALQNRIDEKQFTCGMVAFGWQGDEPDISLIFNALDVEEQNYLVTPQLKWLDIEKRRQRRKEQAKKRAAQEAQVKRGENWKASEAALSNFKQFLKRKHGHYVRAWRNALSPDGSMILHKSDLFKACANIGWQGDVRLLYKACDKDDSGYISIEELDPRSAELLARFKCFIVQEFGNASAAFRALDKHNTRKIRQQEFMSVMRSHGWHWPMKLLFHGLDAGGTKTLVEEDLYFLDRWKPPPFLVAAPSPEAAEKVKAHLIKDYKNHLKAWRHVLDADSSNRCNYDEFESACKKINFKGDVPGAWRALDDDMSGFITLRELDPESSDELQNFRKWCDQEFGGVRSAFGVFDNSGDNSVSYKEFRRSCRIYGYEGNISGLFKALDVGDAQELTLKEVEFLDDWEFHDDKEGDDDSPGSFSVEEATMQSKVPPETVIDYCTDGPGPGAYTLPSTFGAGPLTPNVNFGGAFSFRKRPATSYLPGISRDAAGLPAPTAYDNVMGFGTVTPRKPQWGFGSEPRAANEPVALHNGKPGPGNYSPAIKRGHAVTCTPRRPLRMHPLCRNGGMLQNRNLTPLCFGQGHNIPLTNG